MTYSNRFAIVTRRALVIDLDFAFHFDLHAFVEPPPFEWDWAALVRRRPMLAQLHQAGGVYAPGLPLHTTYCTQHTT